jgi:multiple sugar transport system permease protein
MSNSRPTRQALESSANSSSLEPRGPIQTPGSGLDTPLGRSGTATTRPRVTGLASLFSPKNVFLWPALLVVLGLSIFPLIVSLYLSLSRLRFTASGIEIKLSGLNNYQVLLLGSQQVHLIGLLKPPTPVGWAIFIVLTALLVWAFGRAVRGGVRPLGLLLRAIGGLLGVGLAWLLVLSTFSEGGRPGTLFVTLTYVFVGLAFQYALGLGLALLVTLRLPGRRFFRILFLLPMMITPVGVAYLFQMLTDTGRGPFVPVFQAVGLGNFTWTTDPWLARMAVMIGDIWQWTPFLFIVLLAALEGQDQEVLEASHVDGASSWQAFRHITIPAILPVSTTVILIRMIEAFKIVDLPNILTNGGPGTATESVTLQAYFAWRTQALGSSAALAYILLIIVTIAATAYVNLIRRPAVAEA